MTLMAQTHALLTSAFYKLAANIYVWKIIEFIINILLTLAANKHN